MKAPGPIYRIPLLVISFITLLLGVGAGLQRMGWSLPMLNPTLIIQHGALMISGFFGTLIGLERAVALSRLWVYGAPALSAAASLLLIFSGVGPYPVALYLLASLILSAASWQVYHHHPALFTAVLAIAASCWAIGNAAWLAGAAPLQITLWWLGFLILTIAGERLELSRFLAPPASAQKYFVAVTVLLLATLALGFQAPALGTTGFGISLILLTLWLARYDIAKRTVKIPGLTRFIAVCLLSAYGWLALSGISIVAQGGLQPGTLSYDAALHAITLGFVFGMVFGHAPVILPSVLKLKIVYSPIFYLHLGLLQISLLLRVYGDLGQMMELRSWAGALNALAILVFMVNTVGGVLRGKAKRPTRRSRTG